MLKPEEKTTKMLLSTEEEIFTKRHYKYLIRVWHFIFKLAKG